MSEQQVEQCENGLENLGLVSTIGFNGSLPGCLKVHPDKEHMIYTVGSTVVVENIKSKKQQFLQGHTDAVSCLDISKSGRYIASGQKTHMGFKAPVIVWDFETGKAKLKLTLHNNKLEDMAFSPNDKYLVTLGGMDDGSVVVWNLQTGVAICGSQAQVESAGKTNTVAFANHCDETFVTGGERTLRVWELDVPNRKIRPTEVQMGNMIRIIKCIVFTEDDSFFYCGTTTGDILAINMQSKRFQIHGPKKELFSLGVTALCLLPSSDLLVGAGDGTVCVCKGRDVDFKRTCKSTKVTGAVESITLRGAGHQFFVGTDQSNVYRFNFGEFKEELVSTCHYGPVNDICFPYGSSEVFVTCSLQDIRVWGTRDNKELLRIVVPNMVCNTLAINKEGSIIYSGWNDGTIRAFGPESGKKMFEIQCAHHAGVTALACFSDNEHIVSGGVEGNVRVWQVQRCHGSKGPTWVYKLESHLKEHTAEVTCLKLMEMRDGDKLCISSSSDGTCIIWDINEKCRRNMVKMNTLFKFVSFHPEGHQILTVGTDRNISYWEVTDGQMIRSFKGSEGAINALDITPCGTFFVSSGEDKILRVWKYMEGEVTNVGLGHSGTVSRLKISPCGNYIVSVSEDGAIMRWHFPHQVSCTEEQMRQEELQYQY